MAIKITWPSQVSNDIVEFKVYISETPINDSTVPVATLSGTDTEYTYSSALDNKVYFIKVMGKNSKNEEFITGDYSFGTFVSTGPGSQTLKFGNWTVGYFGRVPIADMITFADLRTAVGLDGIGTIGTNPLHYDKFILNGKILFFPVGGFLNGVTWGQLYSKGLIYGTNDNGNVPSGVSVTPVNQNKVITFKGFNFKVRTPVGSTLPTNQLAVVATNTFDNTEYSRIIAGVGGVTTTDRQARQIWDDLYLTSESAQPYLPNTQSLSVHLTSTAQATLVCGSLSPDSRAAAASGWWTPILELVL